MSTKIQSGLTSDLLSINSAKQAEIKPANPVQLNGDTNSDKVGGIRLFSEIDAGTKTGAALLIAPYTDQYYRQYVSQANLLDTETFNYTAQNTGKHIYSNTTLTASFSAAGLTTNSGNITTTTTGLTFGTYAMFPIIGNANLDAEIVAGFSSQPVANTVIDFGFFMRGAATLFSPTDGAHFRLTSAGLFAVINSNGIEVVSSVFSFAYVNNQKYRFYISCTVKKVEFWINDILYVILDTPAASGQPFLSASLPLSIRHAIVGGAAGGAINLIVNQYSVIIAGISFNDSLGNVENRIFGSYQGLSGGVMGSLANYANSTNPTAAIPTNTTAALGVGLGGQFWETDTLAVTTDGIISSYQVPVGTTLIQGKRLKVNGVKIETYIQTALTGGGYNAQFSLAFGHTAVSLATAEAATTKAPRRITIGSHSVAAGALALVQLSTVQLELTNPLYVNPGEFIQVVKKKIGTAPSAGVVAYVITFDYSWE